VLVLVISVSVGVLRTGLMACSEQFSELQDGPKNHNRSGLPAPPAKNFYY
jgi:hypothetical protein